MQGCVRTTWVLFLLSNPILFTASSVHCSFTLIVQPHDLHSMMCCRGHLQRENLPEGVLELRVVAPVLPSDLLRSEED